MAFSLFALLVVALPFLLTLLKRSLWPLSLILSVVLYLALDYIFLALSNFFSKHRTIGGLLGIGYENSKSSKDTRATTFLPIQLVLSMSGSTKYKINDTKSIANFKQTQREAAHSYDLLSETQKLVGKEFTLDDFEKQCITIWINEAVRCFNLPAPQSDLVPGVFAVRKFMHMAMYSPLKGLLIAIKNKKNVDLMNNYMKSLNAEMCQDLVFVAPLMTMIDSLLLALLDDKAVIKQPSELFKYSPIAWIPLAGSGGYRIMTLSANDVNSDANSVFGPPAYTCPGNIVTYDIVKAILPVRNQLFLEVVGSEQPNIVQAGVMKLITNSSTVKVRLTRK